MVKQREDLNSIKSKILEYRNNGITLKEISKELGISVSTARNYICKEPEYDAIKSKKRDTIIKEISELYEKGYNFLQISKMLNINQCLVSYYMKNSASYIEKKVTRKKLINDKLKYKAVDLYETGLNFREIGKILDVEPRHVASYIKNTDEYKKTKNMYLKRYGTVEFEE